MDFFVRCSIMKHMVNEAAPKSGENRLQEGLGSPEERQSKEYERRMARTRDLCDDLLELEKEAVFLGAKDSGRNLVDSLLGDDVKRKDKIGKQERAAEERQRKQLQEVAIALQDKVVNRFGSPRLVSFLKRYFTIGSPTTAFDKGLKAFVEFQLGLDAGKYAIRYTENPIGADNQDVGEILDVINSALEEHFQEREAAVITSAKAISRSLSDSEQEKFLEQARKELHDISYEEIKRNPDARIRKALLLKIFPELERGTGAKTGESTISEALSQHPDFRALQEQLKELGKLEGDPSGLLRLLQQRGLIDVNAEKQPHRDALLLAVIGDSSQADMKAQAETAVKRLDKAFYGLKADELEKVVKMLLSPALAATRIVGALDNQLGTEPGRKPESARAVEKFIKEKTLDVSRPWISLLSGWQGGSSTMFSCEFDGDWPEYLGKLEDLSATLGKIGNRLVGATSTKGEAPTAQQIVDPRETQRWLQRSSEYEALAEIATSRRIMALIREALGLNEGAELNEKHLNDFLERFFLRNVTMNEGEGTREEIKRDLGVDIGRDSNWPIGDILKSLLLNRPDFLKSVQEFSQRIQGEPVAEDRQEKWRDGLVRMARISFECVVEMIQAFFNRGIGFPPTPRAMEDLFNDLQRRFPQIKNFQSYLVRFAGLSMADQQSYQVEMPDREGGGMKMVGIRANFKYPHPTKDFLEFWDDMALTADEEKDLLNMLRSFNSGETASDSRSLLSA